MLSSGFLIAIINNFWNYSSYSHYLFTAMQDYIYDCQLLFKKICLLYMDLLWHDILIYMIESLIYS